MEEDKSLDSLEERLINEAISDCLKVMSDWDTRSKLTISYNLVNRVLRLFCVLGVKEDVKNMVNEMHEGLQAEIDKRYPKDWPK